MQSRTRLPRAVALVVRAAARLVPRKVREIWLDEWRGELAYLHRHVATGGGGGAMIVLRRSLGCVPDAVWIRTHEWSIEMLLQDIRFAARSHTKRPGFALTAVLTLALGVGANTALFSVVNGVLLERLPYPEADRLVRIYGTNPERQAQYANSNPNDLLDVRERADTIEGLSYLTGGSAVLTGLDEPRRLVVGYVHSSYFDVLGATPRQGRWFLPDEDVDGNHSVVVLHHRTWQTTFGADPEILGRQITLSGEPYTIVGVTAPEFADPLLEAELWRPWPNDPDNRGGHFMLAIARLAPDVSVEVAQEEIDALYATIAEEHAKGDRGLNVVPLHDALVQEGRALILLLFGAVGFLLLIVCANIANLMLARAANRRQEVGVRMALGAGRTRLVRQLVTESLLLSFVGGGLGLALGMLLVGFAGDTATAGMPGVFDVGLDLRALAFCFAMTVIAGLLFGIAPAIQATRHDVAGSLRDGARGARGGRLAGTTRKALVIAEVALSLMLLVAAALMLRSLGNLLTVDTGFDQRDLLTFRMSLPESDYPERAEVPVFYEELLERIEALPGVVSAAATNRLPFSNSWSCDLFVLEGWPQPEPGRGECAEERVVNGDYFETLGLDVLRGRGFETEDGVDGGQVVLVSETMAARFIADEEPLGRGFKWGLQDERPFRRVIGIVEDVKHRDLTSESMTEVYMPHEQYPFYRTMYVAVRARDAAALVPAVRAELREMDAAIPIYNVATMEERVGDSVADQRATAQLLTGFAGLAMLLACVGLYGVMAYTVAQRTHEIGVRMALGARRDNVVRMVLSQALRLVGTGVALGALGALALSGALRSVLFEVQPTDPGTLLVVIAALFAAATLAAWLPARRATRVDPVRALKKE